jgi:hypothetical protein
VSRATQVSIASQKHFAYGAITRSGRLFQNRSTMLLIGNSLALNQTDPTTPPCKHEGLGSSAFARRY